MSKVTQVTSLPNCDFCGAIAYADVSVPAYGTWGNVCKQHFDQYDCRLGTGLGQLFELLPAPPVPDIQVEWTPDIGDAVIETKYKPYGDPPVGEVVVVNGLSDFWQIGIKYPNLPHETFFTTAAELERVK